VADLLDFGPTRADGGGEFAPAALVGLEGIQANQRSRRESKVSERSAPSACAMKPRIIVLEIPARSCPESRAHCSSVKKARERAR
jgi:hypothetical protein